MARRTPHERYLHGRERVKQWLLAHPGYNNRRTRKDRDVDKEYVYVSLGNECARCHITDRRVLQVDHINRIWTKVSKYKRGGKGLYNAIRRGLFPLSDFQLLCANCNWIKRYEDKEFTQRTGE